MDVLTPVATGVLLALFTAVQALINKGRFDSLDKRVDRFEKEMAELRSMIMHLAIAIGVRPRPQSG